MKFYLRDINQNIVEHWKTFFGDNPDFNISCGDIFKGEKTDAVTSPSNSFGYLNGGIDFAYTRKFGLQLENRLQHLINAKFYGELPVGQAVIIPTASSDFPYLISAPTMRIPSVVRHSVNAYLAFRAALIAIKESSLDIKSVLCPGLGIGIGEIAPFACAKQMFHAYEAIWLGKPMPHSSCADIFYNNQELTGWAPTSLHVDGKKIK